MIIGVLISFVGLIMLTVLKWLPSATANPLDPSFTESVTNIFTLAKQWDYIFPLTSIVWLAIIAIPFWLGVMTFKVLQYMLGMIRGN